MKSLGFLSVSRLRIFVDINLLNLRLSVKRKEIIDKSQKQRERDTHRVRKERM